MIENVDDELSAAVVAYYSRGRTPTRRSTPRLPAPALSIAGPTSFLRWSKSSLPKRDASSSTARQQAS